MPGIILADTCSTVNVFCTSNLLHDIHEADYHVTIRYNAAIVTANLKWSFLDYKEPVWVLPNRVANILSFYLLSQHYHIIYDNIQYLDYSDMSANKFVVC